MMKEKFLERAKENLKAAHLLFDNALYNAMANRAYYAAFHAAIVALAAAGHIPQMRHETVQAKFNDELIRRRKLYPRRFSSSLSDLQLVRNKADYDSEGVSKNVASRMLAKAEKFVRTVEKEINP
mgnify:CR=1 FL=1